MACDKVIPSTYFHNDGGNFFTGAGAQDTEPAGWGAGSAGWSGPGVGPCGYTAAPQPGTTNCEGLGYWDPVCGVCVIDETFTEIGVEPPCCVWNALGDCTWAQALCPDTYSNAGSVTRQEDCSCCVTCPSGYYWDPVSGSCLPSGGTYTSATSAGAGVKLARDNAGTPVVAQVLPANALRALRYTDDFPPVQDVFDTIDSAVFGASFRRFPSGRLGVVYGKGGNIEGWISQDQGRSFPGSAFAVASGYKNPTYCYLPGRGLVVVALQNPTTQHWYLTVGSLGSDGVTWTFSTPTSFVTSAETSYAELLYDAALGFLFFYTDGNGFIQLSTCRELSAAGVGTWSSATKVGGSFGNLRQNPTACLAKDRGLVAVAYQIQGIATTQDWLVAVGTLNSAGTGWSFSSERTLVVNSANAQGPPQFADLGYGADRTFTFVYVDSSGNIDLARCRNLAANGTGTWSTS